MFRIQSCNYRFNDEFSIEECVYSHGEKAVLYSPINAEVLLCKQEFIDFLNTLHNTECFNQTLSNYAELNPEFGSDVISKLLEMKIIVCDDINDDNGL